METFREMRRKRQQLSKEETIRILKEGNTGVLALHGDDGYPYTVPINYVYANGKLYFHSARTGHKIDAIRRDPKCTFCVIDQDRIVPEEYTAYFRSAVAFGHIEIIEDEVYKREAIELLAKKYNPTDVDSHREAEIEKTWKALCMLEMKIDHLSGKEAKELMSQRNSY